MDCNAFIFGGIMSTTISSSSAYAVSGYQLVTSTSYTQQAESIASDDGTSSSQGTAIQSADSSSVSKMGKLLSKLQSLADTDQDAFKETAQTISDNLAKSAADATDPLQKQAFSDMSAKFADAAQSGSMDNLTDLSNGASILGAGSDNVSISDQAKALAAQETTASTQSSTDASTTSSASDSSGASAQASGTQTTSQAAGGIMAGGSSSSSSSSSDSEDDIDDEITSLKEKIAKKEASLKDAKQQGKTDVMKADEAEKLTTELADLNTQLSELQMEKLQAQSEESSSSSSSSSGGASMTAFG